MAARLMPGYKPKTDEGRRIQIDGKLRKAREAEERARQIAQSYRHRRTVAPPLPADDSETTDQAFAEEAARLVSPAFLVEMQVQQHADDPYTFFAKDPSTRKLVAWKSDSSRLRAVWLLFNAIFFPDER